MIVYTEQTHKTKPVFILRYRFTKVHPESKSCRIEGIKKACTGSPTGWVHSDADEKRDLATWSAFGTLFVKALCGLSVNSGSISVCWAG